MIGDITVTPSDIENLIKRDKLVAARTLNLANSGYYPLPRTIYFLREILVFLGYMPVRNLAMQAAMLNLFRDDPTKKLKIRTELWHQWVVN
jgi:HD-like signal output (HDOD) protein